MLFINLYFLYNSACVPIVIYSIHSQTQAQKNEGCGSLITNVKFSHSIMNGFITYTRWGIPQNTCSPPLTSLQRIHTQNFGTKTRLFLYCIILSKY